VEQLYKLASINLCPNTLGQVALSCMVNPPKPGDPSHALWQQETSAEFASLRRRARMVADAFNGLDGVTCTATDGAMYAFPRLRLPPKAVAAAEAAGKAPDAFYCLKLLDAAGIVTVPGSGFGQQAGTFHLRTTILPRKDKMAAFCAKFKEFHERFMAEYA
jgi:aspartate/methionine/tyrosine aminotransferase